MRKFYLLAVIILAALGVAYFVWFREVVDPTPPLAPRLEEVPAFVPDKDTRYL